MGKSFDICLRTDLSFLSETNITCRSLNEIKEEVIIKGTPQTPRINSQNLEIVLEKGLEKQVRKVNLSTSCLFSSSPASRLGEA